MEDREMPRMHKYGESKTAPIMIRTVCHVTSSSGLRKFQAAWFLLNRGYHGLSRCQAPLTQWHLSHGTAPGSYFWTPYLYGSFILCVIPTKQWC